MTDPYDVNLMTTADVAEVLQLSCRTLEEWRQLKKGPKWRYVGATVRYRMSDVQDYINSLGKVINDEV